MGKNLKGFEPHIKVSAEEVERMWQGGKKYIFSKSAALFERLSHSAPPCTPLTLQAVSTLHPFGARHHVPADLASPSHAPSLPVAQLPAYLLCRRGPWTRHSFAAAVRADCPSAEIPRRHQRVVPEHDGRSTRRPPHRLDEHGLLGSGGSVAGADRRRRCSPRARRACRARSVLVDELDGAPLSRRHRRGALHLVVAGRV